MFFYTCGRSDLLWSEQVIGSSDCSYPYMLDTVLYDIVYRCVVSFRVSKSLVSLNTLHLIHCLVTISLRSYSVNVSATSKNTFKHLFPSISLSSDVVNKLECLCINLHALNNTTSQFATHSSMIATSGSPIAAGLGFIPGLMFGFKKG
jgi:PHP family Zn ribbon phosphoesterase